MDQEFIIRNSSETYVGEIRKIVDLSPIVQEIDGSIENAWKVFDGILNRNSASRATHAANAYHRLRRHRGLVVVNSRCIFRNLLRCCRRRSFAPRQLQHFDRNCGGDLVERKMVKVEAFFVAELRGLLFARLLRRKCPS